MKKINTYTEFTQSLFESNNDTMEFMQWILEIFEKNGISKNLESFQLDHDDFLILFKETGMSYNELVENFDRFFSEFNIGQEDRNYHINPNSSISQFPKQGDFSISKSTPFKWRKSITSKKNINWRDSHTF